MTDQPPPKMTIREVFEHWKSLAWDGTIREPIMDKDRRQVIIDRRTDGYAAVDLCQAITGYSRDPWWNGEKDGRAKLSLCRLLKNADSVERGIQLYASYQSVTIDAHSAFALKAARIREQNNTHKETISA